MPIFDSGIFDSGIFDSGGGPSLTADAILKSTATGSLAASAVVRSTGAGSLAAAAVVSRAQSGSLAVSAVVRAARTGSLPADAVVAAAAGTRTGSLTADAATRRTATASLAASAVVRAARTGSLAASADLWSTRTGSLTASAAARATRSGSLAAGSLLLAPHAGSLSASAYLSHPVFGSLTASAATAPAPRSFTVDYCWTATPGVPVTTVPTRIYIGGVEVTGNVEWATARFTARVNGAPGEASLELLDRAHSLSFSFGQDVRIYIAGVLRWGGFIQRPTRTFPLPVMGRPLTDPVTWHLECVDYNHQIFDRRVVRDTTTPSRYWNFAPGTTDKYALEQIWGYADTAGYSLHAEHVGGAVLDIPGVTTSRDLGGLVASSGYYLRDVFASIARNTAAIYFCTPDRRVMYIDSDSTTSPYTLTDTPSGPADVGYREAQITEDSTDMVNHSMVWGAGKGSSQIVFSQVTSSASVSAHGLWEHGQFTEGIYRQATADAVASSLVNGSPSAHRGAKDPKRMVSLVTDRPVFSAGDVVDVACGAYGYTDTLPIREMTVTWPTPGHPRSKLVMSWEIDAEWSMYDPWLDINGPVPSTPCLDCGAGGVDPPACPPTPTVTSITDTYTRLESGQWGTADCGIAWAVAGTPVSISVDGGVGQITVNRFVGTGAVDASLDYPPEASAQTDALVRMRLTTVTTDNEGAVDIEAGIGRFGGAIYRITIWDGGLVSPWTSPDVSTGVNTQDWFYFRLSLSSTFFNWRIWQDGATEPTSWESGVPVSPYAGGRWLMTPSPDLAGDDLKVEVSDLDITGVTGTVIDPSISLYWDDFDRVVPSGWDVGSAGQTWTETGSGTRSTSVAGSSGVLSPSAFGEAIESAPLPAGAFLMTTVFTLHNGVDWFGGTDLFFSTDTSANVELYKGGSGTLSVSGANGSGSAVPGLSEDVWYWLKWDFHSVDSHVRAKIWADGTAEPAWQVDFDDGVVTTPPTILHVDLYAGHNDNVMRVDLIDFDYAGKPCWWKAAVPVEPVSPGTAANGLNSCDELVPQGAASGGVYPSGTQWKTTQASYTYGAVNLAVDGVFQYANFTQSDPANGLITINRDVPQYAVVTLCYITSGPLPL